MSAENFLAKENFGISSRTKSLTTADGAITYTAKTGRAADDFVIDRVIKVTTTPTYSMTINVPDGVYYGQELLVIFEVEGETETIAVTTTTGDDGTSLTAAGGYNRFEWHGSTLGWCLIASSAT